MALGSVCALIWMLPLADRAHCTRGFALFGCCAASGISIGVAISPLPGSASLLPVIVSWSCLLLSGLVLFARSTASARVTVQGFAMIAAALTLASLSMLNTIRVAPLIFAASIIFVSLSPHLALQIPDHQILDLPLVMKRLPSIRLTVLPPPSRITPSRINKTLAEANFRSHSIDPVERHHHRLRVGRGHRLSASRRWPRSLRRLHYARAVPPCGPRIGD